MESKEDVICTYLRPEFLSRAPHIEFTTFPMHRKNEKVFIALHARSMAGIEMRPPPTNVTRDRDSRRPSGAVSGNGLAPKFHCGGKPENPRR